MCRHCRLCRGKRCRQTRFCKTCCCAQLVEDSNGNVKIVSGNAGKEFAAEEISAQVLRKLVDDAAKFLNDKVPAQSCARCRNSLVVGR